MALVYLQILSLRLSMSGKTRNARVRNKVDLLIYILLLCIFVELVYLRKLNIIVCSNSSLFCVIVSGSTWYLVYENLLNKSELQAEKE